MFIIMGMNVHEQMDAYIYKYVCMYICMYTYMDIYIQMCVDISIDGHERINFYTIKDETSFSGLIQKHKYKLSKTKTTVKTEMDIAIATK